MTGEPPPPPPAAPAPPAQPGPTASRHEWHEWRRQQREYQRSQWSGGGGWYGPWPWAWGGGWGWFGGAALVVIGVYYLLANLGLLDWLRGDILWPTLVILLGIGLLVRRSAAGGPKA